MQILNNIIKYIRNFQWQFAEAITSISSNKLRVLLTSAIISIGIASLVGILTSIDGIKSSVSDSFSELGSNAYYIRSVRNDRGKQSGITKKNYPPIVLVFKRQWSKSKPRIKIFNNLKSVDLI